MDYLNEKWTLWYRSLDVNHDGDISFADVEECRNKFVELNDIQEDEAQEIKSDVEKWWTTYILQSKDASVSLEQFLERLGAEYENDKDEFVKKMTTCFSSLFNVFDTNDDREISVEELIIAFKAFGHDNENLVRHNFELMQPNDEGTVPLQDVVDAWVQFTTCDDPEQKDIVRDSFEEGV